MIFKKRIERAMNWLHEKRGEKEVKAADEDEIMLEKNDFFAMVIAAFLVFLPVILIILGIMLAVVFFWFVF